MIYDACMFLNEHELFDFRVKELDPVVDLFIVVESEETFTGKKRTAQFKRSGPKIAYVKLDQLYPPYVDQASGWDREAYQREMLLRVAMNHGADVNDVLIVSDCDEIPRAESVRLALTRLHRGMCRFDVDCYYYDTHNFVGNTYYSPVIGTISQYAHRGGAHLARKEQQGYGGDFLIKDAGWHFSYWGGIPRMREKIEAFAHATDDMCQRVKAKSDADIAAEIQAHRNIYYPDGGEFFEYRGDGDPRLPKHLPKMNGG